MTLNTQDVTATRRPPVNPLFATGSDKSATRVELSTFEVRVQESMKTLGFGIEMETVGRTRKVLAERMGRAFGTAPVEIGGGYDKWQVPMPGDGESRVWTVMRDGSLTNPDGASAEVVSPILQYSDMPHLKSVANLLRRFGCRTDASCGMHVHVDASKLMCLGAANLATRVANYDNLWEKQLGIQPHRRSRHCGPLPNTLVMAMRDLGAALPKTLFRSDVGAQTFYSAMEDEYISVDSARYLARRRYHSSRYYGVNLHSVFYRGTVEMRLFEATLHAGELQANVALSLGLVAACNMIPWTQQGAFAVAGYTGEQLVRRRVTVAKALMDACAMAGPEFGLVRAHLLRRLCPHAAERAGAPE